MLDAIKEAILHTPWWVFLLLIYLLRLGIRALHTRIVSIKRLIILPALLLYMSLHTLITVVKPDVLIITGFSVALTIGAMLGFWQVYRLKIEVDKQRHLIKIPGSPVTLIVMIIIFSTKYYFGYELARDPNLVTQTGFELSFLAVSGLCAGLFVGRLIRYLLCFKIGKHVSLPS